MVKHDAEYFADSQTEVQAGRAFEAKKILNMLYKLQSAQLQQHGVVQGLPYYQLCPKCFGEGYVPSIGSTSSLHRTCPVCNGAKTLYHALSGSPTVGRAGGQSSDQPSGPLLFCGGQLCTTATALCSWGNRSSNARFSTKAKLKNCC